MLPRRPSLDISVHPHGLWSLWDMIQFRVKPIIDIQDVLVQLSVLMHSRDPKVFPAFHDRNKMELVALIDEVLPELASSEFLMCRKAAERLRATLLRTSDAVQISADVDDLRRRLLDQMESTFCLVLSDDDRELFDPEFHPFGFDVDTKFPSANEDVYEACRCLALGRSTACVMHLMRASEVALKVLAETLEVAPQNDWGAYLRKIDEALEKRAKDAPKRSEEEQFYSEAAASFGHLKRAWRNPTMHVDKTYSPERAHEILNAVKSFMSHLATKISEKEYLA